MHSSALLLGLVPTLLFFIGFMSFNASDQSKSGSVLTTLQSHTPPTMLSTLGELTDRYNANRVVPKVILLLLDGFRYDYMSRMTLNNDWPTPKTHRYDKLIVEPPTSTSQKIKTVICGTQSVLSEIAKSFSSMRV
jgi:hypothetical protein